MFIAALIPGAGTVAATQLVLEARAASPIHTQAAQAEAVIPRVTAQGGIDMALVVIKPIAIPCPI